MAQRRSGWGERQRATGVSWLDKEDDKSSAKLKLLVKCILTRWRTGFSNDDDLHGHEMSQILKVNKFCGEPRNDRMTDRASPNSTYNDRDLLMHLPSKEQGGAWEFPNDFQMPFRAFFAQQIMCKRFFITLNSATNTEKASTEFGTWPLHNAAPWSYAC